MASIFATPVLADFRRTKIAVLDDFAMIGGKLGPEGLGTILSEWFITGSILKLRNSIDINAQISSVPSGSDDRRGRYQYRCR